MMTPPPDERIVAPPAELQWEERVRPDGATISFVGRPPRTHFGVVAIFLTALAVFQIRVLATTPHWARVRPTAWLIMTMFGAMFAGWRWTATSTFAARVDVDGKRVRLEPASRLRSAREIPLADADQFLAETEIQTKSMGGYQPSRRVETQRWYAVHLDTRGGERVVIASFADRECALFIAQRLDLLTERAKVLAGLAPPELARKAKPYRS
ncbi:MAG TPA: hypothetical protein VLM85_26680 [Polyangiaceae bacterium]|nr:hypothetical protein [Polyangiaceae bacterium]